MNTRMIESIEFSVAGRTFAGILAVPDGAARGAVLVCHGGFGLVPHERERAARLAERGYIALAPDLFGETFADRTRGREVIGGLIAQPALLRERVTAAWRRLGACPGVDATRTAAVGHCFGGLTALELARSGADVRAVVSLHGALHTREPARAGVVRARVLACTGAADPHVTAEHRATFEAELTAAGVDWQHHVYGGALHGFTVPGIDALQIPGCAYDERADRRSWRTMLDLFDEVFA
jgi:dienelactone hydrolase